MKYFIRSIKYFIYFSVLTSLIVGALVLIGAVEGDINEIFEGGWDAVWKIAVFFAAVSAVYPKVTFITRDVPVNRNWEEIREDALSYFRDRKYEVESETPERITLRMKDMAGRLSRMYEDRITVTRTLDGYEFNGHRKDVMRLAAGFENTIR